MTNQQDVLDTSRVASVPDEQDFVIFMRQNEARVFRLAFYLLGSKEEAKDAVQETFVKAWKKFDTLQRETSGAWLSKTTVNLCLDWLRRRKFRGNSSEKKGEPQDGSEHQLPDPGPNPLERCVNEEMRVKVSEAILELPPPHRAVVILRDLEGMSYQDITEALNTSISKVKSDLFRGRRKLKEILRPFFEVSR